MKLKDFVKGQVAYVVEFHRGSKIAAEIKTVSIKNVGRIYISTSREKYKRTSSGYFTENSYSYCSKYLFPNEKMARDFIQLHDELRNLCSYFEHISIWDPPITLDQVRQIKQILILKGEETC